MLYALLEEFLRGLDERSQVLFIRRYYYMESVKELAQRFDVTESFVSVRLHRARKMLKELLRKEGIVL